MLKVHGSGSIVAKGTTKRLMGAVLGIGLGLRGQPATPAVELRGAHHPTVLETATLPRAPPARRRQSLMRAPKPLSQQAAPHRWPARPTSCTRPAELPPTVRPPTDPNHDSRSSQTPSDEAREPLNGTVDPTCGSGPVHCPGRTPLRRCCRPLDIQHRACAGRREMQSSPVHGEGRIRGS